MKINLNQGVGIALAGSLVANAILIGKLTDERERIDHHIDELSRLERIVILNKLTEQPALRNEYKHSRKNKQRSAQKMKKIKLSKPAMVKAPLRNYEKVLIGTASATTVAAGGSLAIDLMKAKTPAAPAAPVEVPETPEEAVEVVAEAATETAEVVGDAISNRTKILGAAAAGQWVGLGVSRVIQGHKFKKATAEIEACEEAAEEVVDITAPAEDQ